MAAKKKLQVFVSSTYLDLKDERQAAVEAILKAGHIPAGMELFSAGNESQMDTIRRWIDESDIYMLILGGRYGSIDPTTALSYTEREYDYAVSKEIPVFAVAISEPALDVKIKTMGKDAIESEHPAELKLFREKVLRRVSRFFSDCKDIKLAVHETIADFLNLYEFTGWVSGSEVAESSALIQEISSLRAHATALEKELERYQQQAVKSTKRNAKWDDAEFEEALKLLSPIEIETNIFNQNKDDQSEKKFLLIKVMDVYRDDLISGVSNAMDSSKVDTMLYFNVCPKLELHGLAAVEKVAGVRWRRYRLTPKGLAFLVWLDIRNLQNAKKESVAPKAEKPLASKAEA
jgi:hypothetical protein